MRVAPMRQDRIERILAIGVHGDDAQAIRTVAEGRCYGDRGVGVTGRGVFFLDAES